MMRCEMNTCSTYVHSSIIYGGEQMKMNGLCLLIERNGCIHFHLLNK